jgi:hypothetical protein
MSTSSEPPCICKEQLRQIHGKCGKLPIYKAAKQGIQLSDRHNISHNPTCKVLTADASGEGSTLKES